MKCPKCGEELPLLSKVCPVCKTVVDKPDGAPDAIELSQALDSEMLAIRQLVPEASGLRLGRFVPLYLIIAGILIGAVAAKTGAGLLWILTLLLVIIALIKLKGKKKDGLTAELEEHKIAYDYGVTLVKRYYSGNREMSKFVEENSQTVRQAEAVIAGGRRKTNMAGLAVGALEVILCLVILALVPSGRSASGQVPTDYDGLVEYYIGQADPQQAINTYLGSEYNDDFLGAGQRVSLCKALCTAGYTEDAAAFVTEYCLGKMQDTDCAATVVRSYLSKGQKGPASDFILKCTGALRYKSDIETLKALVK